MKRKLLTIFTALALCLSLFPAPALAAEPDGPAENSWPCGKAGEENAVTAVLENGALTISGSGEMADYSNGADAPWASVRTDITSIVIEEGVTSVGQSAFDGCSAAASVKISEGVETIGASAFGNCIFREIALPESLTGIGADAFANCPSLESVTFRGETITIGTGAFDNCGQLQTVTAPCGASVGTLYDWSASGVTVNEVHGFDENGFCSSCGTQAKAKVGSGFYISIADACAAAGAGSAVLTLLDNVDVSQGAPLSLTGGTLDLNGKTLRGILCTEGAVTITDSQAGGKIQNLTSNQYALVVRSPGLKITGGSFSGITCDSGTLRDLLGSGYAFYKEDGSAVELTEDQTELPNGPFTVRKARLDLSDKLDGAEDTSLGYEWIVHTVNEDEGKITSGILILSPGFNADEVTLPDAGVTIVTEGDCRVDTLAIQGGSAQNTDLTFSGRGTLTVRNRIEISGGKTNDLTVAQNATVVAESGISIGESGVGSTITVDGVLRVRQGSGPVDAIYGGKVAVGSRGILEVSGGDGLFLFGVNQGGADSAEDFRDLFTVADGGRFTADCSEHTVRVQHYSGSFPTGTNVSAQSTIPLGRDYLPEDCEARKTGDRIELINTETGDPYTGPITIHRVHTWKTRWEKDGTSHWHACEFEGCDKRQDSAAHSLSWQDDDTGHWQECDVCGYKTGRGTHTPGEGYEHDETGHWHACTTCGHETGRGPHSPGEDYEHDGESHWFLCTECGFEVGREPHRAGGSYQHDGESHWFVCADCGCETGHLPHRPDGKYQSDENGHWQKCADCGRSTPVEKHVYDGSQDATCNICGHTRTVNGGGVSGGSSGGGGGGGGGGGRGNISTYTITVEKSEHGKVTSDRVIASGGSTVTLTVAPDSGYTLDTLAVTDSLGNEVQTAAQGGGRYTFAMPRRNVTVKAAFASPTGGTQSCDGGADCPSRGFADLGGPGTWYHEAVDYVLRNGLMGGYGNGRFGPDNVLTRAQFAQILYNQEGKPAVTGGTFADVAPGAWCASAVAWAAERGIADGYGDGRFGPNQPITREQLAVMLWRYAGSPAADQELPFRDADQIGAYAREAVRWAVENGVMSGRSGGALDPKGLATRAQAAQMLKNFADR